ncbi:MAG: DUF6766 family protein [Hyphomonadaceae bacterium]
MNWVRDNGLTLALMLLFGLSIAGQAWAGWLNAIEEMTQHQAAAPTLAGYVTSAEFVSTVFENWESEFLQMAAYVVLTAHLFQRGSAESRDPDDPERERDEAKPGLVGVLYAHSLGLMLGLLFVLSFAIHLIGSAEHAREQAALHGERASSLIKHLSGAQFWFESFQNWQSEFLSTAVLVVLSIYLRERGSPESKPVQAPNSETGAA